MLGRLRALVDRDDQEGVGQLVAAQPGLVEQLVGEPEANSLLGPVFAVRLEDPRAAAALAPYVMAPFDGWASVVDRGRERARALLTAGGGGEAEVLLAALEDMLLTEHPELDDLGRAAAFHAALARLRLPEPGTDEGAYLDLAAALDGGYRPGEESPGGGGRGARRPRLAPCRHLLVHHRRTCADVVGHRHPGGGVGPPGGRGRGPDGRGAGHQHHPHPVARFELVGAALAGAERRHDAAAAERLVGHIDDVTARAAREALDERWAATLAANEMVRLVLEPHHADALRIEVLRRVGRLDEARHVARSLFHRAAAGTVRDFAAADLLELLGEIGADADELAGLAPLVRERPAPALDPAHLSERQDPVVVLFVGGNEVQAGYRPHVDAGLAERWGEQVRVEWFITGWGTNWGPEAERIETAYDRADAVVLMTFVRTNLGRWVRRTAGEHGLPWVSCTGHGRAAIERSIDYAIRLAQEPAAGRASG